MSEHRLCTAPLQRALTITRIDGDGPLSRRLLALGFQPGTAIMVLRRAPLGDPLLIALPWSRVALRRDEAARVLVSDPCPTEVLK